MAANLSQQSKPLHVENTVLQLGKHELSINQAFYTYRDMKLDGVVSGSMSFIKALLSKGGFSIPYHAKSTAQEKKLIDALNLSLETMEEYDKKRLVSNWLSMLDYGCSLNEVVCERVGGNFVFKTISPIHLTTVEKFQMKGGKLDKLLLNPADNDGLVYNVDVAQKDISGSKILFFRIEPDSDFPLGKSLLYGAYTAWKAKKILQEYEAIGVAKNLSGVLDIKVPSSYITKYFTEPNTDEAIYVANLITQAELLHAGKGSYILTGSDTNTTGSHYLFEVTTVGGSGGNAQNYNVGQAIARYNQEIQLSLQTMVLSMGAEGGGSFALSDNSTYLMTLFIENVQRVIGQEFKKAIRIAFELNGLSLDRIPTLEWEALQPLDWDEFTKGWQRLLQSGGVTATQDLETFFREQGQAPQADYTKKLNNTVVADASERAGDKEG